MKKIIGYIAVSSVLFMLTNAPALAWKVKVNETQDGKYTASLIHDSIPALNETVEGTFDTKKEARKAGKAAKKEKEAAED